METQAERDRDEARNFRVYGFRRGIGFQPSSVEVDQSMEMKLEFDDRNDEQEDLEEEDLDADETWPSRLDANR